MTVVAFIGLGSNLNDPRHHVTSAVEELQALSVTPPRASPLYGSKAIGPGRQPDYVNAVARVQTLLSAHRLLAGLQRIEDRHGRVRTERWAARTLDLDLLLYGDAVIDEPALRVPHPRLAERPFVLYPLFDLAPDLRVPGAGSLRALVRACPGTDTWPLSDD